MRRRGRSGSAASDSTALGLHPHRRLAGAQLASGFRSGHRPSPQRRRRVGRATAPPAWQAGAIAETHGRCCHSCHISDEGIGSWAPSTKPRATYAVEIANLRCQHRCDQLDLGALRLGRLDRPRYRTLARAAPMRPLQPRTAMPGKEVQRCPAPYPPRASDSPTKLSVLPRWFRRSSTTRGNAGAYEDPATSATILACRPAATGPVERCLTLGSRDVAPAPLAAPKLKGGDIAG